jgi:hypothetical protein
VLAGTATATKIQAFQSRPARRRCSCTSRRVRHAARSWRQWCHGGFPAVFPFHRRSSACSSSVSNCDRPRPKLVSRPAPALPNYSWCYAVSSRPSAPGNLPEPAATDVTPAGYTTWRTRGTLRVKMKRPVVEAGIRDHGPGLKVQPNIAMYSPVQLTETFMLTTFISGLNKRDIKSAAGVMIKPANADWSKHTLSRFLQPRKDRQQIHCPQDD